MIFSWTFAVNDGAGDCVDRSRRQLMRRCGDIPQLPKDPATDSLLRDELQRHKQNCSTHSDYELSKERFQQLREPRQLYRRGSGGCFLCLRGDWCIVRWYSELPAPAVTSHTIYDDELRDRACSCRIKKNLHL